MRLSKLQEYILSKALEGKNGRAPKGDFYHFYPRESWQKNKKNIQDTIHKSIESLVEKDLLIAHGRKTAQKWFINRVKLTNSGKRVIKEVIKKKQRKLPLK